MIKKIIIAGLFLSLSGFAQSKKWTLEECIAYAMKNNISIKQSNLDEQLAQIDKKTAIGNFLPTLNANASHSWNIGLNQNITTGLLENQTTQFTSAGLNSNILIYNGLQYQNKLLRANLSIIATQYQLLKMKEDVSLYVANAFLQILFNKENLKVQNELLNNNQKQLQRTQELVNSGLIPRGDLLDINATIAGNKQAIVNAENALLISKLSLAQLLQLDDFQNFDVEDSQITDADTSILLQSPETIYKKAKAERIELKIAKTNLEIAQKDITIAKADLQPSLHGYYNFSTRAGYSDKVIDFNLDNTNPIVSTSNFVNIAGTNYAVMKPNVVPVFGKADAVFTQFDANKGHSFGVQLSMPILNGFSVKNNIERRKVNLERYKTTLSQKELDLERSVYTAFTDARGAMNAYESSKTALLARQEASNYAKEKFAVGLMNSFEFNQAQTLTANAKSEVIRTKYDLIFKIKTIELYFGVPIFKINK